MKIEHLNMPNHVAIIVDGNGRWAKKRGLSRSMGHKAGSDNLEKIARYIISKGVSVLSLFVFSTENFKRSKEEVDYLMDLFVNKFQAISKKFNKENIKIVFSGRREPLNEAVLSAIDSITEQTKNNTGGIVNFCLNYGGHAELIDAAKKISIDYANGKIDLDKIDENVFQTYLYQDLPPIDLLIRTSGENRISNFMLWQLSYSEFYFTPVYFPDFDNKAFDEAILEYNMRNRRFGGIKDETKNN